MGRHEFNRASASASRWAGRAGKLARRPVAALSALGLVIVAGAIAVGVLPRLPVSAARADDATASLNNLRTGWDSDEPNLAPVSDGGPVGGADFGQIFATQLKGQIYAQPLVVGKVLVVATETNHVYGLNAATGAVEWSDDLGKPEPYTATGCNNLTPDIGVTSTPVYDPATGAVYLTAVVDNGPSVAYPHVYLYALSPATGHKLPGWPVDIHGSPVNAPTDSFSPLGERQRAGLLLLGGSIYAGFGSYCDYLPYAGYVAGVNTSTRHLTLWTDEAGVTDNEGGIWQSGGGLMSDGPSRIFIATGNGVGPPAVSGTTPIQQLGDAVVRLDVGRNGTLSQGDFFSPVNAPVLDQTDGDFGSGGPVGLPFGTPSDPDLLVQAGKDGRVFLLNRDNLGGRSQGSGGTDDDVSMTGPFGGLWGHPAAFGPTASVTTASSDDYVYYVGRSDVMRYLQFGASASGTATLTDVANTSTTFGYSSGSPVVTSNGDDPGSAVVWEVYSSGSDGADGSLDAFAAVPSSGCATTCEMAPLWSAPIGNAAEFTVPTTDDGRVYVGTRDGTVLAFGSPDSAPLTAAPVNFNQVSVGKARAVTATLTAAAAVTVTGLSVSEPAGSRPFKVRSVAVAGQAAKFPVSLAAGDKLSVRLAYLPTVPGGVTGALQVRTSSANFPLISVSLTGEGTLPGLQASAAGLTFRRIAVGMSVGKSVIVTNDSTGTETIAATSAPAAPFAARLPASGTELEPGQSVAVPVTFDSTATTLRRSDFSIATTDGHRLTVRLTGSGEPAVSKLTAKPGGLSFGSVRVGSRASKTVVISNAGNLLATITGTTALGTPFGLQAETARGLPLVPHYQLRVPITFTPTSTGPVTASWVLRWHDAAGTHRVSIPLSGTGVPAASGHRAILPPGGGWTLNGSATMSGSTLNLTSAETDQAGSAVYAVPESTSGLKAGFTATIGGDGGLTLGLLNAQTSSPSALGHPAGGFGLGGLSGVAVTLATGQFAGDPAGNFAGIAISSPAGLHYVATTTNIPNLALGANRVRVSVAGRRVRLYIAGSQVLTALLSRSELPEKALIAFTGGSGSAVGSQAVTSVSVSARGQALPPPGGGWSFNSSAQMSGSAAELTRAAPDEAGSVVYPVAVPTSGLTVTFTAELSGGSGADGMTFALLDPATSTATSVGGDASGDGFAGLGGVAIGLDTDLAPGYGVNSNYVYLAEGTAGSTTLSTLGEAKAIPSLRPGPDSLTVQIVPESGADLVTVWLDGGRIIQQSVTNLPSTALLAFTGGTGTGTDIHLVRDVAISAAG
jgi:Abnormal spindle-like microcephaly-assoc'd, ASPM-SPD-2-Hydin/PQQ-like domain